MDFRTDLSFNTASPNTLHIDLNSCFATVEQQANPRLRGKPIAVAAFKSPGGCILAPSIEAKKYGIKTGMRVRDGKALYKDLIILEPDPWKYRNINIALKNLLLTYTDEVFPKSIDEFVLDFSGAAASDDPVAAGREIKARIKKEIGDWLTVSIGISTNRFLAKTASSLKKPDGLDVINHKNYTDVYKRLALDDLCGIKTRNIARLNMAGIHTVMDFYKAYPMALQMAFGSVVGHYWYLRLRGWEVDDLAQNRRSYGNSVALKKNFVTPEELSPVLTQLVEKMSMRMRAKGYWARGVHLGLLYRNGNYWHRGITIKNGVYTSRDIYRTAYKLLLSSYETSKSNSGVHTIAVSCFDLSREKHYQLNILTDLSRQITLTDALDDINTKWGNYTISPAKMVDTKNTVKDRIAFGGIKELEEIVL